MAKNNTIYGLNRNAVKIPVFANGNILSLNDVHNCLSETGVEAVMSAEGLLHNPALFTGKRVAVWTVAQQYLKLAKQYPCPLSFIRGHIFKFFYHCFTLPENEDLRERVAKAHSTDVFEDVTQQLKSRYEEIYEREAKNTNNWSDSTSVPPYICQSYIRPEPKSTDPLMATKRSTEEEDNCGEECERRISKKKLKRMNRMVSCETQIKVGNKRILCALCPNPKGEKCDYGICRTCCRKKTYLETLDCTGMSPIGCSYCI